LTRLGISIGRLIRHRFAPYVAVVFAQLPILSTIYSWEPDQHHDGVMFAVAVAVSQGDLPNRDAFAQYGPVTPLIQGFWLFLTSPTVFNMRRLSVIFVVLISVLMYHLLKKVAGRTLALLLNAAWVLTGPFGLPWSSLITTALSLSVIALISSAISPSQSGRKQAICFGAAGFISAIGIFTRIHFILIALAIYLFLKLRKGTQSKFRFNYFKFSFLVTLFSIVIIMSYFKLLIPYVQQCIIWAFGKYSTAPDLSKKLLVEFLWIPTIAIALLTLLLVLGFSRRTHSTLGKSIALLLVFLIALTTVFSSRLTRTGEQTLRNPKILLIEGSQKFLYGVGYFAITFLVFLAIYFFVKQKMALQKFPISVWVAVAALGQLYPFFDPHHVWFISPILIIALLNLFDLQEFRFRGLIQSGLKPMLTIIIVALYVQFVLNTDQTRYQYSSPQMLGMSSIWRSADEVDRTLIAMNTYAIPNSVQFECADGLFAVGNGKYLADSPMFVTWGPTTNATKKTKQLFGCYLDSKQIDSYLDDGYTIIFKEAWQPLTSPVDREYWNVLFKTP
jgi:hypothetical protein